MSTFTFAILEYLFVWSFPSGLTQLSLSHAHQTSPCSWLWPSCGRASRASSGSASTGDRGPSPGRWSATCWRTWSARQRTSTGSADLTWARSRSTATVLRGVGGCGRKSARRDLSPSFLNTNAWRTTWATSTPQRHGPARDTYVVLIDQRLLKGGVIAMYMAYLYLIIVKKMRFTIFAVFIEKMKKKKHVLSDPVSCN